MSAAEIKLSEEEIAALTQYAHATKQLRVLHSRGFTRAFIDRKGKVILERAHYEAVSRGELQTGRKVANLSFLKAA